MDFNMAAESTIVKPQINQILRKLMAEVDITEAELARKTGIPQPTLHRILSGSTKSPRGDSLLPLANFYCITINQLIGDEPLSDDRIPGTFNPNVHGWTTIPVITWEMAANWSKTKTQLKKQSWGNWVSTDAVVSNNAFALMMQGDAMMPRFPDGTVLVIDPNCTPKNRDFVIGITKDQSTAACKQLLIDGSDRYLKPINKDFQSTLIKDNKDCEIIGVVVQARMDFRQDEWQADADNT